MKFVAILVSFIISLSALIATSAEETTDTELRLDRICPYTSYSGNVLTYQSLLEKVLVSFPR